MKRALPVAAFAEALRARADAVPVLVIRVPALERAAWREGLRRARALERRVLRAFVAAADGVLRGADPIAHDAGSDVFLAALVEPRRDGARPAAIDARTALARLERAVAHAAGVAIRAGWAPFERVAWEASPDLAVEAALDRGERERERYAFFATVGHELRTPLSSIRGYLETILDDAELPAETRAKFIAVAFDETLRLGRLVDGMFDISMLDLGAGDAPIASGSLGVAVAASLAAVAQAARARDVAIASTIAPATLALRVAIAADRLTHVLVNLFDNAIKHGRRGGIVRVGVYDCDEHRLTVCVDDDGPGIPHAEREAIFGFGQRGATRADGSGIGLALARALAERAGGTIAVETSPLGGARFAIALPIAREDRGAVERVRSPV